MRQDEEASQPGSEIVFRATYDLIARTPRNHLYDLTDIFADHGETVFVETNHTGPEGNALVAKRMFDTITANGGAPSLNRTVQSVSLVDDGRGGNRVPQ